MKSGSLDGFGGSFVGQVDLVNGVVDSGVWAGLRPVYI